MPEPSRWITVGELAQAFAPDSNAAEPTESLAGSTIRLHLQDGQVANCHFGKNGKLSWTAAHEREPQAEVAESYLAFEMRPGIYFVDFGLPREKTSTVTLVLDTGLGIATALFAKLPDEEATREPPVERVTQGKELTGVSATFLAAALDQQFTSNTPRHPVTQELVGRRVEYTYSPTERYEHIYLNENFYTWHCLLGAEKGLADTDRCHYYRIADQLYFFVWREKIIPTVGAVLIDLELHRSAGKLFGYQADDLSRTVNFAIGSRSRLLNVTDHDPA